MTARSWLFALLAAGVLAAPLALAPPTGAAEKDDDRLDEAWKDALAGTEGVLTEKQFAMLNNLAYQSAATRVCDGLDLNPEKFAKELDAASATGAELTDEENTTRQTVILIELGVRTGLFLAEGNANKEAFCKNAADLKGKTDVPNVWD